MVMTILETSAHPSVNPGPALQADFVPSARLTSAAFDSALGAPTARGRCVAPGIIGLEGIGGVGSAIIAVSGPPTSVSTNHLHFLHGIRGDHHRSHPSA